MLETERLEAELKAPVNSRHLIPGLDAIRVIAVVIVLLWHFEIPTSGPLGVMIFFVLSGFLITGILLEEFRSSGTILLKRFYFRRSLRIFPTFYACWVLVTLLRLLHHTPVGKWSAIGSFFYLTDYIRATHPNEQSSIHLWISWSLAIEEQFYLLWPAALLLLLRRKVMLAKTISAAIVFVWIYRYVLMTVFGVSGVYMYNAFDTRIDALLTGGLLAVVIQENLFAGTRQVFLKSPWLAAIPVALLSAVSLGETSKYTLPLFWGLASFSLQPIVIAVMIVQVVHWSSGIWSFLEAAWIKFLARLSYALYLYHIVARDEAIHFFPAHWQFVGTVWAVVLAILSYFLIERPFLQLRKRQFA